MEAARWVDVRRFRLRAALAAASVWAISLLLPALSMRFDPSGPVQVLAGYKVLASGWFGLMYLQFGWLANILLAVVLAGWASGGMTARSLRIGALALLATSFWTLDLPLRPTFHHHEGFGPGYWVWMANNLGVAALVLANPHRQGDVW